MDVLSGMRRGEPVLEVCRDFAGTEMVHELECARVSRFAQQKSSLLSLRQSDRMNEDDSGSEGEFLDADSFMAYKLFGGDSGSMEFHVVAHEYF